MNALLLHEWHRTSRMLGAIVLACVVVTALGCTAMLVPAGWVRVLGLIAGLVGVTCLVTGLQIALTADYWRTTYGRMGYFTQTLPYRGSRIYGARLLYGTLVMLVGTLLTGVLGFLLLWVGASVDTGNPREGSAMLTAAWGEMIDRVGVSPFVVVFLAVWISAVSYLAYFYFSVSVGHEPWLAPLGWGGPVVVAVVMYVVLQLGLLLAILAVPLGVTMEGQAFHLVAIDVAGAFSAGSDVDALPLGALPGTLILLVAMVIRTAWSWNHKVSLR